MSLRRAAIVLAPPSGRDLIVTGLTLTERAIRVVVGAGIAREDIFVVQDSADVERIANVTRNGAHDGLLLVQARDYVVAEPLVVPLRLETSGTRIAVDTEQRYAGAIVTDGVQAKRLLACIVDDPEHGHATFAQEVGDQGHIPVTDRARHPIRNDAEAKAADAWQFALVNKPRDAFLSVRLYRPLARPLTRMFLRLPFSPNAISILSAGLSLTGCAIASRPSFSAHVLGLMILFLGGIVDCCDGEVARLRLEGSAFGAWLDAIGDDLSRLALILAVGFHVAPQYPSIPILWMTAGAIVLTLASMGLIYWYCIFVAGSSNNQDYEAVLGIGPGEEAPEKMSLTRWLGDLGAALARRDFIDLAALFLAIVSFPIVMFVGLVGGAVVALAVVLPTHWKIVQSRRFTS